MTPLAGSGSGLPARGSRDRDPCREVADDLRRGAVRVEDSEWPAPIGGVVGSLGVRDDDVGLAIEEPGDVVHLHAGRARPVHDENGALRRKGELLQHLERLLRGLERGQVSGGHDDGGIRDVKRRQHLLTTAIDGGPAKDLTPGPFDVPTFSLGGPDDFAISPDSKEVAYIANTDADQALGVEMAAAASMVRVKSLALVRDWHVKAPVRPRP